MAGAGQAGSKPQQPAMLARAADRNSGSSAATATRVAGRVPPNNKTPVKPSANPSFSRGVDVMRDAEATRCAPIKPAKAFDRSDRRAA
jgi:hypothetical protein